MKHIIMKVFRAPILARLAPSLTLLLPIVAAQAAAVHLGEDGIEYRIGDAQASELAQAGWAWGKLEPELQQLALSETELNVILYLARPQPIEGVATPREIRARHRVRLDVLSQEIAAIYGRYSPAVPLREHEEKAHAAEVERSMSAADRDSLTALRGELDSALDTMRTEVGIALEHAGAPQRAAISLLIEQAGGRVHAQIPLTHAVAARLPVAALDDFAQYPQVLRIVRDPPVAYELDVSCPSVGYDAWWPVYDGGAYDFGIVDSGLREDHPAFSPFVIYSRVGSSLVSDHGTHVAGIVLSNDATYQGGAHGLDAVIWTTAGISGDTLTRQSTTMDNMHWMLTSPPQKPEVVNHSLGYLTANTVDYSDNDSFYDAFIENFNVMVTKSAGNGDWSSANPTITHPAPAYNLLAVGNMDDQDTDSRADDVRRHTTSVGPTVSSRRKPDIVAPGAHIWSTSSEWSGSTPGIILECGSAGTVGDDFIECSGTSMSAPHVAAAILLLEDAGNNNPMAQKAVLINTADAWTSNDTDTPTDDGPVAGSHWDKVYGWGYLDMGEAYMNRGDYAIDSVIARNDTAVPDDYKLYKGVLYADEKLTMVWHKRADTYVSGDPSTGRRALTDLNLRLYRESDGALLDSENDGNDNVHQVTTSSQATVVLKPYAWSTSIEGASSEEFALGLEEDFVAVSPPDFRRNYTRPNWVGPYQTFDVTVRIFNDGGVAAHNVALDVDNIAGLSGFSPTNLGKIGSDGDVEIETYTLTTDGLAAGVHYAPLSVSSYSYLETYTYDTVQGVGLQVENTPPVATCTGAPAYNNDDTIDIGWTASDSQTGVNETYLYVWPPFGSGWAWTGDKSPGTSGTFVFDAGNDGQYAFALRAKDRGGTWEAYPVAEECETYQDTVRPGHTLTSPAFDLASPIPLTFTATDAAPSSGIDHTVFYYLHEDDPGGWNVIGNSTASGGVVNFVPADGDGRYHFRAVAVDNAGNAEVLPPPPNGDTDTVYDTLPPTGSIIIEAGAPTTTSLLVDLELPASDDGAGLQDMRLSNNGTFWGPIIPYAANYSNWNLANPATGGNDLPGIKKVYVQYRDQVGRQTGSFTDTIEYVINDADGDGVGDNLDNCLLVQNAAQSDTDNDNIGNFCDPDIAPAINDCVVNFLDLAVLKGALFAVPGDPAWNADADFNGDDRVNFGDLAIMKSFFFSQPGPSASGCN